MNRFKKLGKSFIAAAILATISTLTFFLYMLLVGIPKTQARNYYNLAEEAFSLTVPASTDNYYDRFGIAKSYLEQALEFWPEQYIKDRLEELNKMKPN
jgi:ABC-type dipeptide/oligopeptide/nickel transport system permease component